MGSANSPSVNVPEQQMLRPPAQSGHRGELGDSSHNGVKDLERLEVCVAEVLDACSRSVSLRNELGGRLANAWYGHHAIQGLLSSVDFTAYQCHDRNECGIGARSAVPPPLPSNDPTAASTFLPCVAGTGPASEFSVGY